MALKNYTTKIPVGQSIKEIEQALVKNGAVGMLYEYEQGTGRIESLKFVLMLNGQKIGFALPVKWRKFQQVLQNQNVARSSDDDYCYRVAWRCVRDWVLAQLALYETELVELPQIFLPFAYGKGDRTVYEQVVEGKLLLGGE